MSSFTDMTLGEAAPLAEKLFESFGVKSMLALINNEWVNVVTIIHFTRRKVDDLNNEYRFLEERLGNIDYKNFKILFQARSIQDFHTVLTELQRGYLKIGDMQTKLLVKNPQEITDQKIGYVNEIQPVGEYAEYNYYGATIGMDKHPAQILYGMKISPSSLGFRDFDEFARSWLGLDSLSYAKNVFVIFPTYITISEIQYQGGNEIKATLKIDKRLFDGSHVWVTRSTKEDRSPILERKKYELAFCENVQQEGFFYVTLRHNFAALSVYDKLSISISNSKQELLARKEGFVFPFLPDASDPFLKVFSLFDAGKKMEEHLLNPKKPGDLVAAFSWLLEMINITSLQLQLGLGESVREERVEKGSADIIACYHESNSSTILAIDCTMSVPGTQKIDRIKNTAEYLSRKIGFPVKAVIVTSANSSTTKEQGQKHAVKIIDNTDLDKMIGFFKKGHSHPARQVILGAD